MNRTDIINFLIKENNYQNYLEIGIQKGVNFNRVQIKNKDGVDPAGNCNYIMTSDEFFKQNKKNYDIIFIDGLHLEQQVLKDIENSLQCLLKNGIILTHDCNPLKEEEQTEIMNSRNWNGTAWKAFARLRMTRNDLLMYVVETDWGVGVIKWGKQKCFKYQEILDFQFLQNNRRELLNLISDEEFKIKEKK